MRTRIAIAIFSMAMGASPSTGPVLAGGTAAPQWRHKKLSAAMNADSYPKLAQAYDNRCFTPYFWCYLPGPAPINSPCWCASPNGPVAGVVR
jgi:hypothetical protein